MKLTLKRIAKKSSYTIGKLYIDGVYECDTLEDTDRGLTQDMPLSEIKENKIKGVTAIPSGTYDITLNVVSPKYSKRSQYKSIGGKLPRLLNVPGYEGVLIHIGNTAQDSEGCILVGQNSVVGKVLNSTATFNTLYEKLKAAEDKITIEII